MKSLKLIYSFALSLIIISGFSQTDHRLSDSSFKSQTKNIFIVNNESNLQNITKKVYRDGTLNLMNSDITDLDQILNEIQLPSDCTFELTEEIPSRFDQEQIIAKYQQYYKGVPVKGGGYKIRKNLKTNKILLFSPSIYYGIELNISKHIQLKEIKTSLKSKSRNKKLEGNSINA